MGRGVEGRKKLHVFTDLLKEEKRVGVELLWLWVVLWVPHEAVNSHAFFYFIFFMVMST